MRGFPCQACTRGAPMIIAMRGMPRGPAPCDAGQTGSSAAPAKGITNHHFVHSDRSSKAGHARSVQVRQPRQPLARSATALPGTSSRQTRVATRLLHFILCTGKAGENERGEEARLVSREAQLSGRLTDWPFDLDYICTHEEICLHDELSLIAHFLEVSRISLPHTT